MDQSRTSTESMARHLLELIEQVGKECWKIEVWADTLLRLASPIPVYETDHWHQCVPVGRNRFIAP